MYNEVVIQLIIQNLAYQKMIFSNQEIAIHLHKLRNLSVYTSGRFRLKLSLVQRHHQNQWKALPTNFLQRQVAQTQNRSELGQQNFFSRSFNIKSGINVEIGQIYLFKLDSPVSSTSEDYELVLKIQLLHLQNGNQKVVGTYNSKISFQAAHEYLEVDYYEAAPSQIIGSFHRISSKFTIKNGASIMDLRQFCQRYYKGRIDQLFQYLKYESFKHYERLAKYLSLIKNEKFDSKQLSKEVAYKLLEPQIGFCERATEISICQVSDQLVLSGLFNTKRRKRTFSVTQQSQIQKIKAFQKLLNTTAEKSNLLWKQLLQTLLSKKGQLLILQKTSNYQNKLKQKIKQSITSCKGSKDADLYGQDKNLQSEIVSKLRNQLAQIQEAHSNKNEDFLIHNTAFFTHHRPILFEEKLLACQEQQVKQIFIFLVHGLGACRLDMQKLKTQLLRYYEGKVKIHSATSNEGKTEIDIDSLGMRLASQIDYQLSKLANIPKLCLIGHSMGGLIIRSALPKLQKYKKHFHSLITLSSPHLGYAYSVSKIVDAGLWYMNNIKKSTSLMQMTMKDHDQPQKTFLYKLSNKPGLDWFKKVVLIGSTQDKYVPYYSARIQKHKESIEDYKQNVSKGKVYCEMVDNILSKVTGNIIRLNANFSISEKNLDNFIGRTAHLNFISNIEMVRAFALSAKYYIF